MPRYFVRGAAESLLETARTSAVTRALRRTIRSRSLPNVLIAEMSGIDAEALRTEGVEVIPGRSYAPLPAYPDPIPSPRAVSDVSLKNVLEHIRAVDTWESTRGEGAHVAIVDTGICGSMREFPAQKQSPHSLAAPGLGDPWIDLLGHGTMTGGIAAGTATSGGRFDGVAPEATVISCKTSFDDTELYQIYDHLIHLVETAQVGRLVVNNSYGFYTCTSPGVDLNDPFPQIVRRAVDAGIVVVFAAGNNHVAICGNDPAQCQPNTIWGVNSMDEVLSVGTVNENNQLDQPPASGSGSSHRDSSRGPGEWATVRTKPDCVAPTYGEVLWGCQYVSMEWWGTSGAAPQVAGLAALLLAKNPALSVAQVGDIIRQSCVGLPLAATCAGSGLIDCAAAVALA